ncbi:MAG: cyclic nucleotide-binding domain-containing protein [Candidatus Thiodiazotropha weberae]|nr:cyclic nucleotide-binding domain-containing protein [Candidatus Thiodiazotropha lotti]MCG8010538.1 cyclic nucleotide-binding domain-containing protein [Candidatus Thiodiazotropha lotti]MCG8019261.1 cyclic nucleotide-binding domain-containing protein [Candidatus Thiodiazotropha lotti]
MAVYRTWQERLYMLRTLETGDCFGEMALMDCKPRSAAVQALEDCQAIQIKAAQLAELYGLDHEQYLMIYMNLGREVCRRLSEADHRLFINRFSLDPGDQSQTDQAQCHQQ